MYSPAHSDVPIEARKDLGGNHIPSGRGAELGDPRSGLKNRASRGGPPTSAETPKSLHCLREGVRTVGRSEMVLHQEPTNAWASGIFCLLSPRENKAGGPTDGAKNTGSNVQGPTSFSASSLITSVTLDKSLNATGLPFLVCKMRHLDKKLSRRPYDLTF